MIDTNHLPKYLPNSINRTKNQPNNQPTEQSTNRTINHRFTLYLYFKNTLTHRTGGWSFTSSPVPLIDLSLY